MLRVNEKSSKELSLSKSSDFVCDAFETITFQESQIEKSFNTTSNALIFTLNVFLAGYNESVKGNTTLVDQFKELSLITEKSMILN